MCRACALVYTHLPCCAESVLYQRQKRRQPSSSSRAAAVWAWRHGVPQPRAAGWVRQHQHGWSNRFNSDVTGGGLHRPVRQIWPNPCRWRPSAAIALRRTRWNGRGGDLRVKTGAGPPWHHAVPAQRPIDVGERRERQVQTAAWSVHYLFIFIRLIPETQMRWVSTGSSYWERKVQTGLFGVERAIRPLHGKGGGGNASSRR